MTSKRFIGTFRFGFMFPITKNYELEMFRYRSINAICLKHSLYDF